MIELTHTVGEAAKVRCRCSEPGFCIHLKTMVREGEDWWIWHDTTSFGLYLPMFPADEVYLPVTLEGVDGRTDLYQVIMHEEMASEMVNPPRGYFNIPRRLGFITNREGMNVMRRMVVDHFNGLDLSYKSCMSKTHDWAAQAAALELARAKMNTEVVHDLYRRVRNQQCLHCWKVTHQDWSRFAPAGVKNPPDRPSN